MLPLYRFFIVVMAILFVSSGEAQNITQMVVYRGMVEIDGQQNDVEISVMRYDYGNGNATRSAIVQINPVGDSKKGRIRATDSNGDGKWDHLDVCGWHPDQIHNKNIDGCNSVENSAGVWLFEPSIVDRNKVTPFSKEGINLVLEHIRSAMVVYAAGNVYQRWKWNPEQRLLVLISE